MLISLLTGRLFGQPVPSGIIGFKAKDTDLLVQFDLDNVGYFLSDSNPRYPRLRQFYIEATNNGYYHIRCFARSDGINTSYYLRTAKKKMVDGEEIFLEDKDELYIDNEDWESTVKPPEYEFRIYQVSETGYKIENKALAGYHMGLTSSKRIKMKQDKPPWESEIHYMEWTPIVIEMNEEVYTQIDLIPSLSPRVNRFHNNDCYRMQGEILLTMHVFSLYNRYFFPERFISELTPLQGNTKLLEFKGNKSKDFDFRFPRDNGYNDFSSQSRYYVRTDELLKNRIHLKISGNLKGCHKSGDISLDYTCDLTHVPHFYTQIHEDWLPLEGPQTPPENVPDTVVLGKYLYDNLITDGKELIDYYIIKSPRIQDDDGTLAGRWVDQYSPFLFIATRREDQYFLFTGRGRGRYEGEIYFTGHDITGTLFIEIDN